MEKKEFFILIKMNFSSDSKEFFKLYFYRGKVYHQKSSIVFNSFLHAIFWLEIHWLCGLIHVVWIRIDLHGLKAPNLVPCPMERGVCKKLSKMYQNPKTKPKVSTCIRHIHIYDIYKYWTHRIRSFKDPLPQ